MPSVVRLHGVRVAKRRGGTCTQTGLFSAVLRRLPLRALRALRADESPKHSRCTTRYQAEPRPAAQGPVVMGSKREPGGHPLCHTAVMRGWRLRTARTSRWR